MKTVLPFIAAGLTFTASIASAGGISLAWNDCLGAGGASNRTFACDTNVGTNDLYVSFDPAVAVPDVNGVDALIDVQSASSTLPTWWQFKNAGSCRISALSSGGIYTYYGSCAHIWSVGSPFGPIYTIAAYYVTAVLPSLPPNTARILAGVTVPTANAAAVAPGTEYFATIIRISNQRTVGAAGLPPQTCTGCEVEACLALDHATLLTNNSGDFLMTNPLKYSCPAAPGTYVTWQGGPTPTVNRTWGQIKTLYR